MLQFPDTALPKHRQFLTQAIPVLAADPRLLGVAASGSYSENNLDTYSDLDLVIAIAPEHFTAVMSERPQIAAKLGPLLGCFTGEHVGEPRLLICLYGPDLVHVDLKFVALPDAAQRVDQPVVLWQRQQLLSDVFASGTGHYPKPDPQWLEDRIWIWCHYGADKILRGELLEADAFWLLFAVQYWRLWLSCRQDWSAKVYADWSSSCHCWLPNFAIRLVI